MPQKYTKELLESLCIRDNATLVGTYEKISCKTKIHYICSCGKEGSKTFSVIPNYKMICRTCINKVMVEKTKITNLERYNCEDPNKLDSMKDKIKATFIKKYGVDSPTKTESIKTKIKNTNIKKYGVENPFQNEDIKKKITNTFINKYGVEHALQHTDFKEKFKNTLMDRYDVTVPYYSEELKERGKKKCLEKYGVEHALQNPEIIEKIKRTCLEKYGVESPFQSDTIRNKSKNTCLRKYGVENPSQCKEIQQKTQNNALKYKKYTMPSGEIRNVQGYEPFALNILLKMYKEDQIKTNRIDIPRIKYNYDNKLRYYFPDIYIPHLNKIIEVKSEWTYKYKTDIIKLKGDACIEAGYDYDVWIFNTKGERVESDKN
jgi:hypothetical protein